MKMDFAVLGKGGTMSVLIKGMKKPKSCTWWDGRCPLLGDDDDCKLQDCQEEWTWQDQYKGCPLSDAPDTNVDTISRQDVLALAKDVTLQNGCKHRCIDATMIHELPPAQLGTMAVRGYPIDADYLMAKVAEEYGERARDALYRIIRYMPPAQSEPQWIPVSERLPENRDWVLGIFQEGDTGWINPIPFICDYVGNKTPVTTQDNWLLKLVDEPHPYYERLHCIAWMPLPEPYVERRTDA